MLALFGLMLPSIYKLMQWSVVPIDRAMPTMSPHDAVSRTPVDGTGVSQKTVQHIPLFGLMQPSILKLMRLARAMSYSVGSELPIDSATPTMPPHDAVSRTPVDSKGVSQKTGQHNPLFVLMQPSILKPMRSARAMTHSTGSE
eukprot:2943233-Prymnesium_polylepis.1